MIEKTKEILKEIAKLLRSNNHNLLADNLCQLYATADEDPDYFIDNVKSLFGGMGTLNDVVFSINGKPLQTENDELEMLREQLYKQCKKYKYSS